MRELVFLKSKLECQNNIMKTLKEKIIILLGLGLTVILLTFFWNEGNPINGWFYFFKLNDNVLLVKCCIWAILGIIILHLFDTKE